MKKESLSQFIYKPDPYEGPLFENVEVNYKFAPINEIKPVWLGGWHKTMSHLLGGKWHMHKKHRNRKKYRKK